ncbi:hypothetical protein PTKIN_Ptkin14bG0011000 [Pterospermum kingtungense]
MAGIDFQNPQLQSLAAEVAKSCAGLPLAIVTDAKALKNKDFSAWKDASLQLQRSSTRNFTGVPAPVYAAIELSYNSLESEELKKTFLLCCMLGYTVHIQYLWVCAMGLQLFDGVNTVEETQNRVLTLVSSLKASCLLLDDYIDHSFCMHDLVRDVSLEIASRDNHAFALKNGDDFECSLDNETMQKLKMISLSSASIKKLPCKLELECPQLSLFIMKTSNKDSHLEIPTSFFEKMKNIKVLDLANMDFSSLIN